MMAVTIALAKMVMFSAEEDQIVTVTVAILIGQNGLNALRHVEEVYRQEADVVTILQDQAMAMIVKDHLWRRDLAIKFAVQHASWW